MKPLSRDLTRQQLFDALVNVALAGHFPARNAGGTCAYRTEDGRACAVGLFLPAAVARRCDDMGASVNDERVWETVRPFLPDWMDRHTAAEVQTAHDMYNGEATHARFVLALRTALAA